MWWMVWTHWGLNKMADILQTTFSNASYFDLNFIEVFVPRLPLTLRQPWYVNFYAFCYLGGDAYMVANLQYDKAPTLFQKWNSSTFQGLFTDKITFFKHYRITIWRIVNTFILWWNNMPYTKLQIFTAYILIIYTMIMNFTQKGIDLVICTVENTAHWISSDGDLMTKLPNPVIRFSGAFIFQNHEVIFKHFLRKITSFQGWLKIKQYSK